MSERRHARGGASRGIALGLALGLCATAPAVAGPSFDGQGRVIAIDAGRSTVMIEHGGIPGLLAATRSEFPVQSAAMTQGVRLGDRVRFTLSAADESHGLLTVVALTPEPSSPASSAGWPDHLLGSIAVALGILTLAGAVGVGIVLWRELQVLHRRVVALDHEAGMLRGLVGETQDGVRQIAGALEEAASTLRLGYIRELRRRLLPWSSPAVADGLGTEAAGGLLVVQRGRGELYRAVQGGAAGPGLAVIWDRRRSERRQNAHRPVGHERRRSDRRSVPAETWTRLGFQLVPGHPADVAHPAGLLQPAGAERGTPG